MNFFAIQVEFEHPKYWFQFYKETNIALPTDTQTINYASPPADIGDNINFFFKFLPLFADFEYAHTTNQIPGDMLQLESDKFISHMILLDTPWA